jgi:glycosyltransferase involved in cell wall biosynthesis
MIVKDESRKLRSFLDRIKNYVDEIIIVDTGSSDNSKEIAKKFTSKVYDFRWDDDFSSARNFSISKATKEWILWLDPDEEINFKDLEKIRDIVNSKSYLGYRFVQKTIINGKEYIQGICKLFQNLKGIKFVYPVHESVMPSIKELNGKIGKTGIVIKHNSDYDLKKAEYYLRLIEKKAKKYPESSSKEESLFMKQISESFKNEV